MADDPNALPAPMQTCHQRIASAFSLTFLAVVLMLAGWYRWSGGNGADDVFDRTRIHLAQLPVPPTQYSRSALRPNSTVSASQSYSTEAQVPSQRDTLTSIATHSASQRFSIFAIPAPSTSLAPLPNHTMTASPEGEEAVLNSSAIPSHTSRTGIVASSIAAPVTNTTATHSAAQSVAGTMTPSAFPQVSPDCSFMANLSLAVFMHSFPSETNGWRRIFDDEVRTLLASPLTPCGAMVYLGRPPYAPWPFADGDTPYFMRPSTPTSRESTRRYEEVFTLASLYEYCEGRPDALVAYVHDKGTRARNESAPRAQITDAELQQYQWDWRKMHEYFVLEVPQGCISAIAGGVADVCGANWRVLHVPSNGMPGKRPAPHFSGNFWWATCAHVVSLPHPLDYREYLTVNVGKDISTMMWLGSSRLPDSVLAQQRGAAGTAVSCWDTGISDHHKHPYPRSEYEGAQCSPDTWKVFTAGMSQADTRRGWKGKSRGNGSKAPASGGKAASRGKRRNG